MGGSQYNLPLGKCTNPIKLFLTETDASTKATLLYRRYYWGVEELCCSLSNRVTTSDKKDLCCDTFILDIRDPGDDDCNEQGFEEGDEWISYANTCPTWFINLGGNCCPDVSGLYVGSEGNFYTNNNGEVYCGE